VSLVNILTFAIAKALDGTGELATLRLQSNLYFAALVLISTLCALAWRSLTTRNKTFAHYYLHEGRRLVASPTTVIASVGPEEHPTPEDMPTPFSPLKGAIVEPGAAAGSFTSRTQSHTLGFLVTPASKSIHDGRIFIEMARRRHMAVYHHPKPCYASVHGGHAWGSAWDSACHVPPHSKVSPTLASEAGDEPPSVQAPLAAPLDLAESYLATFTKGVHEWPLRRPRRPARRPHLAPHRQAKALRGRRQMRTRRG
jgi:hypothetical protein